MFRPGKNPKDQAGEHTPEQAPNQAPNYGNPAPASAAYDRTNDTTLGARTPMSDPQQNASRAYSESESLARDIKEGTLSGFVGNGTTLTGEANFKGMLRVDGHLSGRVSSQDGTLIISSGGQVDADIEVSVAQIYGTVNGDIVATKRIELGRVARVTGNIQTPALVIEQGAIFEGSCRMQQVRDAQAQEEKRAATASATTSGTTTTTGSAGTGTTASSTAKPDTTKPGDKPADAGDNQTGSSKPATVTT
jgi:cytoskeletal protein CcmA (bactofilin family)